jgi:hypothetical protein
MPDPQATATAKQLLQMITTGTAPATPIPDSVGGNFPPVKTGLDYVNSLYPNEIEFYAAALELVNGDGLTEQFFSFPVMFKTYRENKVSNTAIEKTMAGVVITANPTFVPFDIFMTGNFGRKFKKNPLTANANTSNPSTAASSSDFQHQTLQSTTVTAKIPVFSTEYKTGYGCYKILERMMIKSQKQDSNYNPYQLFFYNLALNSNYLVEVLSIEPSQNRDSSNMIWEYNLHLKAVALASSVKKNYKTSLKTLTNYNNLTQETVFQANEIEQYKQDRLQVDLQPSIVDSVLQSLSKNTAYSLQRQQINGINSLLQLAANPTNNGALSLLQGQGILRRF